MRKVLFFPVLLFSLSVFAQDANVALLYHKSDQPNLEFLKNQSDLLKDDFLYIYGFKTSPYSNFSKTSFLNGVSNGCSVDTTQLVVYVASALAQDLNGQAFIMTGSSDSTKFDEMLSINDIKNAVKGCRVRNLLMILDVPGIASSMSSFSKLKLAEPILPDSTISTQEFIDMKMKSKSRTFVASAEDGLPESGRYTLFASKMMEALRNYGGSDGLLTLGELESYLQNLDPEPFLGVFEGHEDGSDFLMIAK